MGGAQWAAYGGANAMIVLTMVTRRCSQYNRENAFCVLGICSGWRIVRFRLSQAATARTFPRPCWGLWVGVPVAR
jgi:hypothetical protein